MTEVVYKCRNCERIVDIRVIDDCKTDKTTVYTECEDYPNCG